MDGLRDYLSWNPLTRSLPSGRLRLNAVAAEAGTDVQVVTLFVGSLGGPGSGAENYVSMMLANAELISGALNAT